MVYIHILLLKGREGCVLEFFDAECIDVGNGIYGIKELLKYPLHFATL